MFKWVMNFVILKIHFQLTDPRHLKISSCIFKSENLTEQNSLICQDLHVDCRVILIYSRWETLGWPSPEFISRCRPASRIYNASSKCWTTWNASPHRLHHISATRVHQGRLCRHHYGRWSYQLYLYWLNLFLNFDRSLRLKNNKSAVC